jgi:hypothetical protein
MIRLYSVERKLQIHYILTTYFNCFLKFHIETGGINLKFCFRYVIFRHFEEMCFSMIEK